MLLFSCNTNKLFIILGINVHFGKVHTVRMGALYSSLKITLNFTLEQTHSQILVQLQKGRLSPLQSSQTWLVNGRAGTVSFQNFIIPTIYLRHKSFVIHEDSNDGSTLFKYDASFKEHTNYLGQSGYNAYEATNPHLNGFFIRHQSYQLIISTGHSIHRWADQLFKAVRV